VRVIAGRYKFVFWRSFRQLVAHLSNGIPLVSIVAVTVVSGLIPFGVARAGLASCVVDTVRAALSTGLAANNTLLVEDAVRASHPGGSAIDPVPAIEQLAVACASKLVDELGAYLASIAPRLAVAFRASLDRAVSTRVRCVDVVLCDATVIFGKFTWSVACLSVLVGCFDDLLSGSLSKRSAELLGSHLGCSCKAHEERSCKSFHVLSY